MDWAMAQVSLSLGLMWAITAIGIYISYRILDFADLTAEGSFTLGAAVSASMIVQNANPFLAIGVSVMAGMLAGLVTGFLHTKLKIPALLSGILSMTALYSVNIRVMKKSNVSIMGNQTIFSYAKNLGLTEKNASVFVALVFVIIIIVLLWWFFNTEIGNAVRATGDNEHMVKALGVNTDQMKIVGLVIGNGLVALSGSLIAQDSSFADVGMGVGTIVIGLAAIIIGEVLFRSKSSFKVFIAIALGSVLYRFVIAFGIRFIGQPSDLKMITAALIALILALPLMQAKIKNAQKARSNPSC